MLIWVLRESGGEKVQVIHIGTALLRRSGDSPNKLSVPPEHNNEFGRRLSEKLCGRDSGCGRCKAKFDACVTWV